MVKRPPTPIANPLSRIAERNPASLEKYLELFAPLDDKGRYLHFDELRFRFPEGLDHVLAWSIVKLARQRQLSPVLPLGEPPIVGKLMLTPAMQIAISESDRHTTSAALEWMSGKIGEHRHLQYLLNDLVEDEAIGSSQLEGAATTTKVAKDLLKRQRGPRTPDEKMIVGNFRMMQFAWENRHKALSPVLIAELHEVGVAGIDDEKYYPGVFRTTDDVIVQDGDGNTVHMPPPAKGLEKRLARLAEWANANHHDVDNSDYLHPLLKAIVLHFSIGFEHPFRDGNGRVARSLFYWYLFKQDFAAFRYIAISTLLKKAPIQYGKSYLYTETDDMDLSYFADHQCRIVIRAISEFKKTCNKTLEDMEAFNAFLFKSGLYQKLTDKQKTVFQVAKSGIALEFTAVNVKENLGCSYNTAAATLNGLVELKLFKKEKVGREWVFTMLGTDQIIGNWKS
ncbi:Fic family protein [Azorhizophilus paspali]|uniref:Fic family protein n=1 Tax=Azorhizophilus paspali TaxID=69963 RepID=A0ABV6SLM4_AZOPA